MFVSKFASSFFSSFFHHSQCHLDVAFLMAVVAQKISILAL
jgi:hypothetical protein